MNEFSSDSESSSIDSPRVNAMTYPEISLAECFNENGDFDEMKFFQCRRRQQLFDSDSDDDDDDDRRVRERPPPKKRNTRTPILARRSENGQLLEILPTDSLWYVVYVASPNVSSKRFQNKFRR